jgi:hypothetical protein
VSRIAVALHTQFPPLTVTCSTQRTDYESCRAAGSIEAQGPVPMSEESQFIDSFVAMFLASYCAVQYDFHCQTGTDHSFPIEDAEFLAEEAWKEFKDKRR